MTGQSNDDTGPARSDSTPDGDQGPGGIPRWRRIVAVVLIVVGVVLVPVSMSAIWVRRTLLDTDQYVATVGPLAGNSDIQHGLADRVTTALFADGRVEKRIADVLPPRADVLAAPIASGLETVADQAALKLFQSDQFETVWENVNRRAHTALVKVVTGGGPRVDTKDGTVSVNVEQIFTNVKQRLDTRGITVFDDVELPAKYKSVVLIQSKQLEEAQGLVDLLQKIAWVLPVHRVAVHRRRRSRCRAIGAVGPCGPASGSRSRSRSSSRCSASGGTSTSKRSPARCPQGFGRRGLGPAHVVPPPVRDHRDRRSGS